MTDLTKEESEAWQNHLDKWRKDGALPQPKMIYKAGLNDGRSESQKHITELEEAGRELLIDAMNEYKHSPWNWRKTTNEYFAGEIAIFMPEGGGDD